jgi:hypothetical protein
MHYFVRHQEARARTSACRKDVALLRSSPESQMPRQLLSKSCSAESAWRWLPLLKRPRILA